MYPAPNSNPPNRTFLLLTHYLFNHIINLRSYAYKHLNLKVVVIYKIVNPYHDKNYSLIKF